MLASMLYAGAVPTLFPISGPVLAAHIETFSSVRSRPATTPAAPAKPVATSGPTNAPRVLMSSVTLPTAAVPQAVHDAVFSELGNECRGIVDGLLENATKGITGFGRQNSQRR